MAAIEILALRMEAAWLQLQIACLQVATWFVRNPDEAAGAATGLIGAYLLARKGKHADMGWLAFLASNAAWLWFAWRRDHPALFLQQIGFTCTSLLGLWTWLLSPRLQWTEWRGGFDGTVTMWIMPIVRWRGRRIDLHKMISTDAPECYHTHQARAWRLVLWGGYIEEIEQISGPRRPMYRNIRPGSCSLVVPQLSHRIHCLLNGRVSYSLWVRGLKTHETQRRGAGWDAQIETADHVRHVPSGEDWVVARATSSHVHACGWPRTSAPRTECTLIRKATNGERLSLLHALASGQNPHSDWAKAALGAEPEEEAMTATQGGAS